VKFCARKPASALQHWPKITSIVRSSERTGSKPCPGSSGPATSVARLWRDQRRTDDARDLLSPVHGRFTEGFETSNLKLARNLIDELGPSRDALRAVIDANRLPAEVWP